jgi:transcriptional regulator with XRE-family HTH domain
MSINSRKTRLIEKLQNKEYRDSYVSSNIDVGVAFQIRALRKQRKYTQKKLAKITHMKQERISVLENPSNTPNISTLKKIANAFDVGLIVRFIPISNLMKWQLNLSCESLDALSFNEDPYFQAKKEGAAITVEHEQDKVKVPFTQASSKVIRMEDYLARQQASLSPPQKNPRAVASAESYVINK